MPIDKLKKNLFWIPALTPLYLVKLHPFGFSTNLFELLAAATIVVFLIKTDASKFILVFFKQHKVFSLGLLAIFLGLCLSLFFNTNKFISLGILKSWFIFPIFFSSVLRAALKKESDAVAIIKNIFLSTLLVSLIGLVYKLSGALTYDGRLSAFYLSPNYLAMFLAPGLLLGCFLIFLGSKKVPDQKKSYELLFHLVATIIIALSLYWTYSYATWLALFVAFLFWILLINRSLVKSRLFTLAVVTLFFSFLLLTFSQFNTPKFQDIFTSSPRSSLASRMMIWRSSIKIIVDHPLVGIGAGNFQENYLSYQKYFSPYLEWAVPQPHNLYLAFWLQSGVLGLLGFCSVIFVIFSGLWKEMHEKKQGGQLASLLMVVFIYILTHGLFDTPYWKNDLSFLFWVFAFLAVFVSNKDSHGLNPHL